MIEIEKTLRA